MKFLFAENLDDVASQLAGHMKCASDDKPLTDEEKELYCIAFRAGVAIVHELSLDAASQGLDTLKNLMTCVAVQVAAWDLPFITSYRETEAPDTMQ